VGVESAYADAQEEGQSAEKSLAWSSGVKKDVFVVFTVVYHDHVLSVTGVGFFGGRFLSNYAAPPAMEIQAPSIEPSATNTAAIFPLICSFCSISHPALDECQAESSCSKQSTIQSSFPALGIGTLAWADYD
jgi:hypothetical protein